MEFAARCFEKYPGWIGQNWKESAQRLRGSDMPRKNVSYPRINWSVIEQPEEIKAKINTRVNLLTETDELIRPLGSQFFEYSNIFTCSSVRFWWKMNYVVISFTKTKIDQTTINVSLLIINFLIPVVFAKLFS